MRDIANRLLSLELWIVGGLVLLGIVRPTWMWLAPVAALLFWALRWLVQRRLSVRTPVDISIVLLLLMLPVTLWASALPQVTAVQVLRLLGGVALFYALANWAAAQARLKMLVLGLLLVPIGLALLAPIAVEWQADKFPLLPLDIYSRFPLLLSDPANPNVMAGFLVIFLPLALALLLFAWAELSRLERLLALLALVLGGLMLLLTLSRGAILAFGLALLVLFSLRWRWGWLGLPLVALLGLLLVAWLGLPGALDLLSSSGSLVSFNGRMEVWSRALYAIQDFSLTGIGMGLFMQVTDLLYPLFLHGPGTIEHAHNLFFQVAVDLGIPGLVAWMATLLGVTWACWRLYRLGMASGARWLAAVGVGLLCSQVALVVHGLTDAVTWGMVRPAPLVWLLWGVVVAFSGVYLAPGART